MQMSSVLRVRYVGSSPCGLEQYQLLNPSLSPQLWIQTNPLVTTLLTNVSHLDLLQRKLVSVRSTHSGVFLGEDEDVGEIDDQKAEN